MDDDSLGSQELPMDEAEAANILSYGLQNPFPETPLTMAPVMVDLVNPVSFLNGPIAEGIEEDYDEETSQNIEENVFSSLGPNDSNSDSQISEFSVSPPLSSEQDDTLRVKLHKLTTFREELKDAMTRNGEQFFIELNASISEIIPGIQIYSNHGIVATLGESMLVPMLSLYGIVQKNTSKGIDMIRDVKRANSMEAVRDEFLRMTHALFVKPSTELEIDCTMAKASNMVWNVRLKINENIFSILTFRIVAMSNIPRPRAILPELDLNILLLCFALLSKACAKDFNCLCALPDLDIELFKRIIGSPPNPDTLARLVEGINYFLEQLSDPQYKSKRNYIVTALHNLVASIVDTTQTGETFAYEKLFHNPPYNTFNTIMREIQKVIVFLRSSGTNLQVSLCGGKMNYELSKILKKYVEANPDKRIVFSDKHAIDYSKILVGMTTLPNKPSDADLTITTAGFSDELSLDSRTLYMFYTLCLQLGIKKTLDAFCSQSPIFLHKLAVIGVSVVGGNYQLSSSRNSCDAYSILTEIIEKDKDKDKDQDQDKDKDQPSQLFVEHFLPKIKLYDSYKTESSLAPYDLVPKQPSAEYILYILKLISKSGYVPPRLVEILKLINSSPTRRNLAKNLSIASMSTDEGFSSPVKALLDILFTLFSIENFTNRAFVTQKINKELKRIGVCATILYFHFDELLSSYPVGSDENNAIISMKATLSDMIRYGYTGMQLLSVEIDNIMTTYASCFVELLYLCGLRVMFYAQEDAPRKFTPRGFTQLETDCMHILHHEEPMGTMALQVLPPHDMEVFINTGQEFLRTLRPDFLQNFLALKARVQVLDLEEKGKGGCLTSVDAFNKLLEGESKNGKIIGLIAMLTSFPKLTEPLQPLLLPIIAEIMHFKPLVVVSKEHMLPPLLGSGKPHESLKISVEHQFGLYVLLSIFGVKFKSEWNKIALFIRMLFRELLARRMDDACYTLLGVDLSQIDDTAYRRSFDNYRKDVVLFDACVVCKILLAGDAGDYSNQLPKLDIFYGIGNVQHGIKVYKNVLLDTGELKHPFISPWELDSEEPLLSFEFLNSDMLKHISTTQPEIFSNLLNNDALQPRAYELLLLRLIDKFSNLSKGCDESLKKRIPPDMLQRYGGKDVKEARKQYKIGMVDDFVLELYREMMDQGPQKDIQATIAKCLSSGESECFEASKEDIDKFENLDINQLRNWREHLLDMIYFFKQLNDEKRNLSEFCSQQITKYLKLLFFLKKYLNFANMPSAAALDMDEEQGVKMTVTAPESKLGPPPKKPTPLAGIIGLVLTGLSKISKPKVPSKTSGSASGRLSGKPIAGGSLRISNTKTRHNNTRSQTKRTRKNKHHRKQPHKFKKILSECSRTKSKTKTKSKSKTNTKRKNVTFKRRRMC